MKKIIGIVIASMVFANIAFAETRVIKEDKIVVSGGPGETRFFITTICIDEYKFVGLRASPARHGYFGNLVQFLDRDSRPMKC